MDGVRGRRRRQQLVFFTTRAPGAQLHCLPVADFLTGYAIDRRSDAVKEDDRTLYVQQDRLVFLAGLLTGLKVEIFAPRRRHCRHSGSCPGR
jgi:hypothetical protein